MDDAGPTALHTHRRTLILAAAAILGIVAVLAARPNDANDLPSRTVERGGLSWVDVTTDPSAVEGERATLTARIHDGGQAPTPAAAPGDTYFLYQLADGRFDTDAHSDDRVAERTLVLTDRDVLIQPLDEHRAPVTSPEAPVSGEYTISLDGAITYRDLPSGRYQLVGYEIHGDGSWDGSVVKRVVEVP